MKTPCAMRSAMKTLASLVKARQSVGTERSARLTQMPFFRSIRSLNQATVSPETAMPMVEALTAKPIVAASTP